MHYYVTNLYYIFEKKYIIVYFTAKLCGVLNSFITN